MSHCLRIRRLHARRSTSAIVAPPWYDRVGQSHPARSITSGLCPAGLAAGGGGPRPHAILRGHEASEQPDGGGSTRSSLFLAVLAVMVVDPGRRGRGHHHHDPAHRRQSQTTSFTVTRQGSGRLHALRRPAIESPSAIVINRTTGKVLYEHNANERRPMASTTKIMTAILVLEKMDLATTVTVSAKAATDHRTDSLAQGGRRAHRRAAAVRLAAAERQLGGRGAGRGVLGQRRGFRDEMNKKAAELGMEGHALSSIPNGLDKSGHYSTAADMATLARYAMQNEKFREIVSHRGIHACRCRAATSRWSVENTNQLLGKVRLGDRHQDRAHAQGRAVLRGFGHEGRRHRSSASCWANPCPTCASARARRLWSTVSLSTGT